MDWMGCNVCGSRAPRNKGPFYLTNCTHILCDNCLKRANQHQSKSSSTGVGTICGVCRKECGILCIDSRMPESLKRYFLPESQLKKKEQQQFQNVLRFQSAQMASLTAFLRSQASQAPSAMATFSEETKQTKQMQRRCAELEEHLSKLRSESERLKRQLAVSPKEPKRQKKLFPSSAERNRTPTNPISVSRLCKTDFVQHSNWIPAELEKDPLDFLGAPSPYTTVSASSSYYWT